MNPGYFIGVFITAFFIAEHFLISKKRTVKKTIIALIAAVAAGVFAGYLFTLGINIFRNFMQANAGDTKFNDDLARISSVAKEKFVFI